MQNLNEKNIIHNFFFHLLMEKEIFFQTKLEAKWAYMFDIFGWKWEYKNKNFIIKFNNKEIQVYTKPGSHICDILYKGKEFCISHIQEVIGSNPHKNMLIVDDSYYESYRQNDWLVIGIGKYIDSSNNATIDNIVLRKHNGEWRMGGQGHIHNIGWCSGEDDHCYWADNDTIKSFENLWNNIEYHLKSEIKLGLKKWYIETV